MSDDKFWKSDGQPRPFTIEMFDEAVKRMMESEERPSVEYHHPNCPKILTSGARACRCGAAPLEAVCEYAKGKS